MMSDPRTNSAQNAQTIESPAQARGSASPISPVLRLLAGSLNTLARISPNTGAAMLQQLWFRPLHGKPSARSRAFWRSAERECTVNSTREDIRVHLWGQPDAPLVLGVHGWRGSGVQFRHLVQPLVAQGYQVGLFDLPAHGMHPARATHVLEFAQVLVNIQAALGQPAAVVAHSFGCQSVVQAMAMGFSPQYPVFVAPALDMTVMMQRFGAALGLISPLQTRFEARVDRTVRAIAKQWTGQPMSLTELLSHDFVRRHLNDPGLLIADRDDDEIPWSEIERVASYWHQADTCFTRGLGHYNVLKDTGVVETLVGRVLSMSRKPTVDAVDK
ncbi:alpha/beta fold hydrolase [Natronospirillum operosum]|nr:alpha/beta fold hydrolase [Natronospirillum operosum]